MENRAEFRLGKRIFLGILGNLGSKIDPRDLSKKTRASGYNGHGKRGKIEREMRELSNFFGKPRILFIGRLNRLRTRGVRSYAARTRTSCMTEASTASVRMGRVLGLSGRMGRVAGEVGRMGRRVGRVGRVGFLGYGDVDDPRPILSVTRGVQEYAARTSEKDADSSSDNIRILN